MTPLIPKEEMRRSSKRPQPSSGLSITHSQCPLSAHAFRAKVDWEAKFGEPCPYARSAREGACCPYISHAGLARRPVSTKGNHDSARLCDVASSSRGRTTGGRWNRLRGGFDGAFEDSVCRGYHLNFLDRGAAGSAKFIDKVTGSGSSATRRTATKRCGARRLHRAVTGIKPGHRRKTPTLLEIHQRIIKAALLELSRSNEKPFENLGGQLGREPDEHAYREGSPRVLGGKVLGGLPDCTVVGDTSSTVEEKRASVLRRDQSRSSRNNVVPCLRTRRVNVERTILPPFKEGNEAWKIPLLRSRSPMNEERFRGFYGDASGDAEGCPLNRELSSAAKGLKEKHRYPQCVRTGNGRSTGGTDKGSTVDWTTSPSDETSVRCYRDHEESSSRSSSESAISCTWAANNSPQVKFSTTPEISGVGQQPAADLGTAGTAAVDVASSSRLSSSDNINSNVLLSSAVISESSRSNGGDLQLSGDPPGTALILPQDLLADIVDGRKRLKPASDTKIETKDKLLGPPPLPELEMETMEASDRAAQLRELEDLIRLERLDRFNPETFSRGALYGEGKHALVYRAIARPGWASREGAAMARNSTVVDEAITAMASTVAIEAISTALILATCTSAPGTTAAVMATTTAAISATIVTGNRADVPVALVAAEAWGSEQTLVLAAKEFRSIRPHTPAVSVLRDARREVGMHLRLRNCDRIVTLQGVWLAPRITLLFDPMEGGNLHQFIREKYGNRQGLDGEGGGIESESLATLPPHPAFLVVDVANSLVALHQAGIIHRDVKSHNVMMFRRRQAPATPADVRGDRTHAISDDGVRIVKQSSKGCHRERNTKTTWEAKLGDLGSAALISCEGEAVALTEEIGTSGSTAPEVFSGEVYGTPVDVFSLGVLAWETFVKGALDNPLCGLAGQAYRDALREGLRPPLPAHLPDKVKGLIERCWAFEPGDRPTALEVATELSVAAAATPSHLY